MASRRQNVRSTRQFIRAACAPVLRQKRGSVSTFSLERLEPRQLLSAAFANDPDHPGNFVVTIAEDAAGTNDTLTLRIVSGELQYKLNAAPFTNDLDSSAPGVQALSFSAISRIDVALHSGNDTLTLDASGGNVIPALSGISYAGGTGTDAIFVSQDANYTLTDTVLTLSPGGVVNLSAVEQANLIGGNTPNLMDASAFTGSVTMDGAGQDDTLIGGSGDDVLTGTEGNDRLEGRGGNDVLIAGNSGGMLIGGDGDDTLIGQNGKDMLLGGSGNDSLFGSNGADTLDGGDGDDTLEGELGNDTVFGGTGYDTVKGTTNSNITLSDSVLTGIGTDSLSSLEAAVLSGSPNDNTIDASAFTGDTTLSGGGGNDTLIGASGDNVFYNNPGGNTVIIGGVSSNISHLTPSGFVSVTETGGLDELNFSTASTGIAIDLTKSDGTSQDVDGLGFTVSLNGTFEDVVGTSFSDSVLGNEVNNLIYGGLGTDNIDGGDGNDIIFGGTAVGGADGDANDIIYGGLGADQIDGGAGNDVIYGGAATGVGADDASNDIIFGGLGSDQIDGGEGNDVIFGGTAAGAGDMDTATGGSNDIIYGGLGSDQIDGGAGNDIIFGGTATGTADASSDIIFGGIGSDQIDGGAGNDVIFGGTAAGAGDVDNAIGGSDDIIYGGLGSDQIDGGAGNDIIFGGTAGGATDPDSSNDIIFGGIGNDQIDGGAGNDVIFGGTATGTGDVDSGAGTSNDIIFGGLGADTVDGGGGNDIIFGGTAAGVSDLDGSNDVIYGGLGSDQIDAGAGSDIIFGGTAGGIADTESASSSDIIFGGLGNDQVDGGSGNDIIYGGTGGVFNGTSDQDASSDIIYGGLGADQIDAGAGNDVIFGGTGSPDTDVSAGSDIIYGGAGNDSIAGGNGNDSLIGGTGDDTYLFIGTNLGSDVVTEAANLGIDTLDFSGFGAAVNLDLALTSLQVVNAGNLSLSFSAITSIENVVGSKFADTVFGNGRNNQLFGADPLDDRFANPAGWNGVTQVVFLDFDTHESLLVPESHVYTAVERNAIQARLEADYAAFHFLFTQSEPVSGPYATLFFNKTPVINGQPQPGGLADELDFRNLNLGGTAAIDINPFLGGFNEPAATSANFIAFSATVSAHELGHLVGLRHLDSAGPIGFGIPAALPPGEFIPPYPGPIQAFETNQHLMASPASVGASLFDAIGDLFFGAREALKLAFNESGTTVAEAGANNSFVTAQALGLLSLAVPNTLLNGLHFAKDFAVSATSLVGSVGLSGGASEDDYYSFTGRAGDLINIEVMSSSLDRILNPIDSIVRLYNAAGELIAYYAGNAVNDDAAEGLDSVLLDVVLPSNGTFYIQVDTFTDDGLGVPDTDTGDYELFIYRFDTGNATDGSDYLDGRAGNDLLAGWLGNDSLLGGADNDALIGGAGDDLLQGNAGRDLLIGGLGADNAQGGDGEDLLIAGYTAYDSDPFSLGLILSEWTSSRSYTARIANIRGVGTGPRANGNTFLIAAGTSRNVFDDGVLDVLAGGTGGGNTDWFFYNFSGTGVMDSADRNGSESRDDLL